MSLPLEPRPATVGETSARSGSHAPASTGSAPSTEGGRQARLSEIEALQLWIECEKSGSDAMRSYDPRPDIERLLALVGDLVVTERELADARAAAKNAKAVAAAPDYDEFEIKEALWNVVAVLEGVSASPEGEAPRG